MTPGLRYRSARFAAAWREYWFASTAPGALGLCRVLFFAALLVRIAPEVDSSAWASVPAVFWMPTDLFAVLHLHAAPTAWLRALDLLWRGSLVLACVGLFTRGATMVAFLTGTYLLGLPQCFGKVDHWSGLLVLVMGVLALARSGDAWSIDALLRRRRRSSIGGLAASGEYRWPIQVVRLLMVLVFFAAGIAKIRFGGLGWLAPENLRAILIFPHYANDRALAPIGLALAGSTTACALLAWLTLAFELGAPLALFGGRIAGILVAGLLLMQVGIGTLLGVHAALPYLGCYAFWVPWGAVAERIAAFAPGRAGMSSRVKPTTRPARSSRTAGDRQHRAVGGARMESSVVENG